MMLKCQLEPNDQEPLIKKQHVAKREPIGIESAETKVKDDMPIVGYTFELNPNSGAY